MIELILDKTTGEKCLVFIDQIVYMLSVNFKNCPNEFGTALFMTNGHRINADMSFEEVTELIEEEREKSRIEIHNEFCYEDEDDEPDWNRTEG